MRAATSGEPFRRGSGRILRLPWSMAGRRYHSARDAQRVGAARRRRGRPERRRLWYRSASMSRRYFSVGEVDRMVPKLERIFVQVLQLRAAMRAEELKLEKAGVRLSPELLERESSREPAPVRTAKLMFRAYYDTLTERLGEV